MAKQRMSTYERLESARLNRKQRRELGRQVAAADPGLTIVYANAGGIDVGNESHYVAVPPNRDPNPVREFGCWTAALNQMAEWLKSCRIDTVAMQATGAQRLAVVVCLNPAQRRSLSREIRKKTKPAGRFRSQRGQVSGERRTRRGRAREDPPPGTRPLGQNQRCTGGQPLRKSGRAAGCTIRVFYCRSLCWSSSVSAPETIPVKFPVEVKKTGVPEASANTGITVSEKVSVPDAFLKRPVPPVI
jgi:hypothetical protein